MRRLRLSRVTLLLATDGNPLRRRIDRVEAAIMLCLLLAFLVAAPLLGLAGGRLAGASGIAEIRAESSWRQVPAVLLASGADGIAGTAGDGNVAWVPARWTAPSGGRRTGTIAVSLDARAGQHVSVWVTRTGELTHPKLTSADVTNRVGMGVLLAVASVATLLAVAAWAVRVAANRRRIASWTRAWAATGPRWSSLR